MADKTTTHPDLCVNCKVHEIVGGARKYFAQTALHPKEDDLDFGNEVHDMLSYLRGICWTLGYAKDLEDEESTRDLGQLGVEVAGEAIRRLELLTHAAELWQQRAQDLHKVITSARAMPDASWPTKA